MRENKDPSPSLRKIINDKHVRGVVLQVAMLLSVASGLYWLVDNTLVNLDNQGKSLGFNFLQTTAGFQISQTFGTWLFDYEVGKSTYWEVYFIGIANTFLVAVLGIIAATVIGFTMGIMRLSTNIVFKSFATTYIEILRNVPLLLQLFFWYFAVLRSVPDRRSQLEIIPGVAGLNITGLYLPAPMIQDGFGVVFYTFLLAVIGALFLAPFFLRQPPSPKTDPFQPLPRNQAQPPVHGPHQ